MQAGRHAVKHRRIHAPDQAPAHETFDLFGLDRAVKQSVKTANRLQNDYCRQLDKQFKRLFNDYDGHFLLSPFSSKSTSSTETPESMWFKASNAHGQCAYMTIARETSYCLAELFLGSQAPRAVKSNRTLSTSEQRLCFKLFELQLNEFDRAQEHRHHWHITLATAPENPELLLNCDNQFTLKDYTAKWQFWCQSALVEDETPTPLSADQVSEQHEKLELAARHIPVTLNVEVARATLTITQISRLQPGEIIMLDLPELVNAYVGDLLVAHGRVAEHNNTLVLQVDNS